ncbi:type IV-A pilus assembly ATPase PilB [Spiribacter salinus]|uniref:type IV-A pilus assembly ATPase PilB n=1 Tax=Spiribacter salinus TaxID=1335746 RepID=UPI001C978BEA|nr:type IV-A pilus assembly ATPase PilB [Spiribacter salinus]MBY5269034.1 type IV-A pilus assembly ATPase PilB [Spiribacter salinus]
MSGQPARPTLARRLINQSLATPAAIDQAVTTARANGTSLVQHLLDSGLIPPADMAALLAEEFGLPLVDATVLRPDSAALARLEPELLRRHHALPLRQDGDTLAVAISDPANVAALDEIRFHTGLPTTPVLAEDDALREQINRLAGAVDHDLNEASEALEVRDAAPAGDTDTPVVRTINRLLLRAIREKASDIHVEPFDDQCRIRFRRDGLLHEVASPPGRMAGRLSARLKVMARLDIAERRLPQDGRLRLHTPDGEAVDFRVSVCPTLHGEKLVLRLLDTAQAALCPTQLGFSQDQLGHYQAAIERPHGMVLVTGPTGSGKTVTLYSALQQLNTEPRNVLTVEDPVEINLPGVNQISTNPRIGFDFPQALRAFLRQDPDVIMVGEIRDRETAEIAIKAAQTGHLVLSTLHTNDAPSAVTRLLNMGIPAWNIAASISLIVAQRLVRRLCPGCRRPLTLSRRAAEAAGLPAATTIQDPITVYEPVGCSRCIEGYSGRVGIHEVLPIDASLADQIVKGASTADITAAAHRRGLANLRTAGLEKVCAGATSLAEIDRVTRL